MREGGRPAHRGGVPPLQHRGWHTPRKLPHFDSADVTQAITFRLADSLPAHVVRARHSEGANAYRERIEAALDAGRGSRLLGDPRNAAIVEPALRHGMDQSYDLHAYVVMPNHVHALITQRQGERLAEIVGAWKGWSAKEINRSVGREGPLWQRDYFDRFIRDEEHFLSAIDYIEQNPVKARLVSMSEAWPFGSARR